MKGLEVYAPDWGCVDWTKEDDMWEFTDGCTVHRPYRLFHAEEWQYALYTNFFYIVSTQTLTIYYNDAAVPVWLSVRFACQPEDLRLVNCARKIKKAFRRASNDPSYKMCRRRILTLLYS